MVAARKINKKRLKQPDEFYGYSLKVFSWVLKNWRYALAGLAFSLAILLASWGINTYLNDLKYRNAERFYQALRLYNQSDANPESLKEARELFEKIREGYGRDISLQGFLYLGHIYYKEGNFQQAIDNYLELYRRAGGKRVLKDLSILGLTNSYEALKEYGKAISYLNEIIESPDSSLKDQGYLALARCYEQMADKDKAIRIYQQALQKFPQAPWKNNIETKVEILKNS